MQKPNQSTTCANDADMAETAADDYIMARTAMAGLVDMLEQLPPDTAITAKGIAALTAIIHEKMPVQVAICR